VSRAGRSTRLRQAFVDRPGHIPSTPETVAALGRLDDRRRAGRWPEDVLADLRRRGAGGDCSFADLTPPPMLRPHRAVRP
ncbi:MAG TPA: hypothetical protein VHC23_00950, partial [Jatrophihabitans sp.]|nr:hypothetical protein [Jatrophihabitans sp.]